MILNVHDSLKNKHANICSHRIFNDLKRADRDKWKGGRENLFVSSCGMECLITNTVKIVGRSPSVLNGRQSSHSRYLFYKRKRYAFIKVRGRWKEDKRFVRRLYACRTVASASKPLYLVYEKNENALESDTDIFIHRRVMGDGRCLFRSLVQGVHLVQLAHDERAFKFMALENETRFADIFCSSVCDHLEEQREFLEPFVDHDFDSYVRRMRDVRVWGGEPELFAAANLLRLTIAVFSIKKSEMNTSKLETIARYEPLGISHSLDRVSLLFNNVGHYDLLEKI